MLINDFFFFSQEQIETSQFAHLGLDARVFVVLHLIPFWQLRSSIANSVSSSIPTLPMHTTYLLMISFITIVMYWWHCIVDGKLFCNRGSPLLFYPSLFASYSD